MTKIVIFKDETGRLHGFSEEDERAYAKWRRLVADLEFGETLEFDFTVPRCPRHHRRFMWKVRTLFERTEAFKTQDALREWMVLEAGYREPDGAGGWKAQSLGFSQLDEIEFAELHRKVDDFLWTPEAGERLWPHLTSAAQNAAMDSFFYAVEHPHAE